VELQETAPPRERRPPMRHMVARRVKFGTALLHSPYGTTASSELVGRAWTEGQARVVAEGAVTSPA